MSEHIDGTLSSRAEPGLYHKAPALLPRDADDVFAGGGEMGAHMRAFDWPATSLGPVEGWSQSLRSAGHISKASSPEEACRQAARTLSANPADVPFALMYQWDERRAQATLVASAGMDRELDASRWPLARVAATGRPEVVTDVRTRFGDLPGGRWDEPPHSAVLLPIAQPGQKAPYGVLVAGVSPRLALDKAYRSFFEQAAGHLASAVDTARYAAELEAKQRLLDAVLQQMPAGVIISEPSGRLAFFNHQQEELVRGPMHQAGSVAEYTGFRGFHPDGHLLQPEEWPLARSLLQGEVVTDQELELERRDGSRAMVRVSASPVRDPEGRLIAGVAITRDVTRQKEQEAELHRRVEFEQQLIGIVSHDLRNPIHAITLAAHALLRHEELDARATRAASRIISSAERAARMIRDLLDFTQARLGGGISLERRSTDLRQLVHQVLDEVGVAWPERHLQVRQWGCATGEWDSDRMAQVVSNLVTNALKYSPQDTPVRVELRTESDSVELAVHNEGPPIPADVLPRLFEPLQRGTPQVDRASRSIGLGLYIVKHLMEAHGGTVAARSEQGLGTTFTVRLPRTPGALAHH